MLRSLKSLHNYSVEALDGEIGTVDDFYFDGDSWVVRYLVVDTGKWLPGRRVLIASMELGPPNQEARLFPVELTKEQVEGSPSIAADKPVSKQYEIELHSYYNWVPYWTPGVSAPVMGIPTTEKEGVQGELSDKEKGDPHLRSFREVNGYKIHAKDGHIGHIDELIVEDDSWAIRYAVVDTRNWLPGRHVLVSPAWIKAISWADEEVMVDLTKEAIKDSPTYDPSEPVNRDYELRLYDYYGRPRYWA